MEKRNKALRKELERELKDWYGGKIGMIGKLILMFADFVVDVLPNIISVIIALWFFNRVYNYAGFEKTIIFLMVLILLSINSIRSKL